MASRMNASFSCCGNTSIAVVRSRKCGFLKDYRIRRGCSTKLSSAVSIAGKSGEFVSGSFAKVRVGNTVDNQSSSSRSSSESEQTDVVVVGGGIGGLCCAALLAKYGYCVVVCESHDIAGGAGHSFERNGFIFDSGPSFHAGLSTTPSINPLKQVLDALGEKLECIQYKNWIGHLPEGQFKFTADKMAYAAEISRVGGSQAGEEWIELEKRMEPLAKAAMALPAVALRPDPLVLLTAGRFLPKIFPYLLYSKYLLAPFASIVDQTFAQYPDLVSFERIAHANMLVGELWRYVPGWLQTVKDPFLRRLMDLECFVLSGLLADSTITAEMVSIFTERHRDGGTIDYPLGGGGSIIEALVRGLTKYGGKLLLNTHVNSILIEGGRAVGVNVKSTRGPYKGQFRIIRARKAVVSNASIWDTAKLLPRDEVAFSQVAQATEMTESFVHLHLGIDATGLPADLECHHLILNDWSAGVGAAQNVNLVSIPTVFDKSLAPQGHHAIHAYTAGNEPYSIWKGMDRRSLDYAMLKEERSQVLWKALERVIPDIRDRVKLKLVGTPLTHERYLRRTNGTYGPAIRAGRGFYPGHLTKIPGLVCCGDSTMPGIGVPAVAASGMIAANSLVPFWKHFGLLAEVDALV